MCTFHSSQFFLIQLQESCLREFGLKGGHGKHLLYRLLLSLFSCVVAQVSINHITDCFPKFNNDTVRDVFKIRKDKPSLLHI